MDSDPLTAQQVRAPLAAWFGQRLPDARAVTLQTWERLAAGHSNETYQAGLSWLDGQSQPRYQDWIVRTPPGGAGLLAPYDVGKQFRVMQALQGSPVPVPRVDWLQEDASLIGRPFFAMQKLDGACIEKHLPPEIKAGGPALVRHLCERYAELLAAVHQVDWQQRELQFLGDGSRHLEREIAWWEQEIRRVQQGPVPAFDRVIDWLRSRCPAQNGRVALVHGDAKLGNLFIQGQQVVALLDWEMATLGDPMTDIGWAAVQWGTPSALLSTCAGALSKAELLAHYEQCGGVRVHQLPFYEALAGLKLNAILFVAAMMFRTGQSRDPRFRRFGDEVLPTTLRRLLASIGGDPSTALGDIHATA